MTFYKTIFLLCCFFSVLSCSYTGGNNLGQDNFPSTDYNKVIAYAYEDFQGDPILLPNGELNPSVTEQRVLNSREVSDLAALLNNPGCYGGDVSRCFIPRLGFVFLQNEETVAHVSICLQCNFLVSSAVIPAIASSSKNGFSTEGRKKIIDLCTSLGLEHTQNN